MAHSTSAGGTRHAAKLWKGTLTTVSAITERRWASKDSSCTRLRRFIVASSAWVFTCITP